LFILFASRPSDAFSLLLRKLHKTQTFTLARIHPAQCGSPKFNGVPEADKNPQGSGDFNEKI
jgi:hypothetical protein